MGCAKDIVEYVGVPRLLFSDFPLGNPAGRPKDAHSQAATLEMALRVLETAPAARTTVQNPLAWSASPDWKLDFQNVAQMSPRRSHAGAPSSTGRKRSPRTFARRSVCSARARREGKGGMTKPFAGVRVLDFTQVFAGPFGSYQLALLGADVIKIERRGGEDMRRSPLNKEWAARNMATAWMAINSNKRNIALDLTKPKSIEIVHRLARKADVVMENFRPGIMDRMGIGYEALSAINSRIIYCAVSGFGQNGPERTTAAYDGKIQAMSGIMSVTGHPGEGPMRAGFAICDAIGGMTAAFAVSSALYQRTHTGRGQLVDVAMLDASLAFLSSFVSRLHGWRTRAGPVGQSCAKPAADGRRLQGQGRSHPAGRQQREAVRRPVARHRAAGSRQGPALRRLADARRQRCGAPRHHRGSLRQGRRQDLGGTPDQGRRALLAGLEHCRDRRPPQLKHRDVLQRVETRYGPMTVVGSGFRLAHGGGSVEREPAMPGEHAEEILAEAGYSQTEVAEMRRDAVI